MYTVTIPRAVHKQIAALPAAVGRRVLADIQALASNPRPPGCSKLTNADLWRLRVGTYRVIYAIDDVTHVVTIVRVGHRRDVYR
jgi:mRNA interferase RelE/StbE